MKTPLKLNHMETGEIIAAGIASVGTVSLGGIVAIVKQAMTNTSLKTRLDFVEKEMQDISDIKNTVVEIQIFNAKYFTILEANQKSLEENQKNLTILTQSVSLIHQRIDLIKPGG